MTSESETLDTLAPTATSNAAAIATNQTQSRTAAAQQPPNDIDTSDGSIASIADQVDDNIDEIIEEAIDADADSRSSQCGLLQVDGGDSKRHQFEHHRQQGADSSEKIILANEKAVKQTAKKATVIKANITPTKPKPSQVASTGSTRPPTTATATAVNGANKTKPFDSMPMEKAAGNDASADAFVGPSSSPSPSLALGGFNTLKTDLPGRVSFSKNDVYEIDYSDIDNDTDTSRSYDFMESFRKKNVHFEDEYTKHSVYGGERAGGRAGESENRGRFSEHLVNDGTGASGKQSAPTTATAAAAATSSTTMAMENDKIQSMMESASGNSRAKLEPSTRLDVLPEGNENGHTVTDNNDSSDKIIEDYKREIEHINRQHEMEMKWNNTGGSLADPLPKSADSKQLNRSASASNSLDDAIECSGSGDSWSSPSNEQDAKPAHLTAKANIIGNTSDESATRDSTSTVINNYLKITNQKSNGSNKPASAIIKLRTTKKLTNGSSGSSGAGRGKSGQSQAAKSGAGSTRMTKAKSASHLHRIADIRLDEFQIDKVESWMSTHKDTFSDAGLSSYRKHGKFGSASNLDYKKTWRETPLSKTDDEGNYSLDDPVDNASMDGSTSGGEIELVLKKLEGRRMKISFDSGKSPTFTPPNETNVTQTKSCTNIASSTGSLNESSSSNKIKEIFQYLDAVDFSCDRTISNFRQQKAPCDYTADLNLDYSMVNDIVGDVPKVSDLLMYPSEQLARKVVSLSLRANELTNAIHMSKEHMDKLKSANQKLLRAEKQVTQTRLKEQKNHYETVVARHQEFIEQLLKDKAALCEKVSALTRRIDSQQQSADHKLQTEIQRVKEAALAAEKIRRERWVRDNTKKIKELTVKGLEQELSKMTSNHQKEITELKRQHQQELLDAVDEARHKHESVEMNIRENYAQDREHAIERERNAIRERFQRQMEIEQKAFEEHKLRLVSEFATEKERLQNEKHQKEIDAELQREKMIKDKKELIDHMNREFNDKVRMMEKRHQSEASSIREQFDSDFAIWKREHETAFKLREVENGNAIRQQCRAERDKQIDSIVAKVDAETLKIQQDFELKIGRIKSQYENELREMERVERQTRDKYTETRSKLAEYEGDIQNLNATMKQFEIQLNHSQKMCDTLTTEKEHFKENARRDIQQEVETIRKERDDEIQQIHKRVQHAIGKKDESIDVVQKENAMLKDRCNKLEAIIRQQRKDYCIK